MNADYVIVLLYNSTPLRLIWSRRLSFLKRWYMLMSTSKGSMSSSMIV